MKIVALLDTMWGDSPGRQAPRFFRINPQNHSGRRLYKLCLGHTLVVTNSCRFMHGGPTGHGVPDPDWVKSNLSQLSFDLLLICGTIARSTYKATGCVYKNVLYIDHPAARRWTTDSIRQVQADISTFSAPLL